MVMTFMAWPSGSMIALPCCTQVFRMEAVSCRGDGTLGLWRTLPLPTYSNHLKPVYQMLN